MKRRLISVLLSVLVAVSCLVPVCAAFDDTETHWAREYIDRTVEAGLFKGVSETEFAPDAPMTRAMFVTVLGRLAGVDAEAWNVTYLPALFSDVAADSYYAPYVAWAVRHGITNGTGEGKFSPDTNVTREQMATFVAKYLRLEGVGVSLEVKAPEYADEAQIADWAKESVAVLSAAGIFNGMASGEDIVFMPRKNATRAECATMFCRLMDAMVLPNEAPAGPVTLTVPELLELFPGDDFTLPAMLDPAEVCNPTVIWYSEAPAVARVSLNGKVTALRPGTALVHAVSWNGLEAVCQVTVLAPPGQELANGDMSYEEKCKFIFGKVVDDPRLYYSSEAAAKADMTDIEVPTWYLRKDSGEKVTIIRTIQVHKNLAATVQAIFEEIYALPEQPPINALQGFRWAGKSEHSPGLAIDVNPNENYYCYPDGTPIVGSYFKPGEDPYSIPVGGSVDQIFARYGFRRGIYWNSGYKDYMHYSFFGT